MHSFFCCIVDKILDTELSLAHPLKPGFSPTCIPMLGLGPSASLVAILIFCASLDSITDKQCKTHRDLCGGGEKTEVSSF